MDEMGAVLDKVRDAKDAARDELKKMSGHYGGLVALSLALEAKGAEPANAAATREFRDAFAQKHGITAASAKTEIAIEADDAGDADLDAKIRAVSMSRSR